jgi:putative copper export protein
VEDGFSYAWIAKAIVYGLAQLAIGVTVARRLASRPSTAASPEWNRWLIRLARAVACLLVAGLMARLWVQTASAFGPDEVFTPGNLRIVALESQWGEGWRLQVAAAAAVLVSAWLVPVWRPGWWAFEACAVGFSVAIPVLGHAAGSASRHVVHAVHALGAGAWVGTLGVMTLAAWSQRALRGKPNMLAELVKRFSPLALAAATLVAVSGSVAAWLYVGSWMSLVTTTYGRLLLLKLFFVACVAACGRANWRDARNNRPPRRRLMTLEYLAALLVIAMTGVLTETEQP